jgi:SH3-like domain-containing protein
VNYRVTQIKEQGVRFANALRSVRMRAQASRASRTNAYLMRNDAVVISGSETGWVKVQGADIVVTDTHENIVEADTTGKADGYTASKYLRDPNVNDLVNIEQADQAYWSDIVHINVGMVNLRSHPWYTAPIVTTLSKGVSLYVVATVDNWSQVRNDEGTLRGYIRSDLLTVDRAQRVDNPNTGKVEMTPVSSESSSDSPWIGF